MFDYNDYNCEFYCDYVNEIEINININEHKYNQLKLYYYLEGIKLDKQIEYTLTNGLIKIKFNNAEQYLNKKYDICLSFTGNNTNEPIYGQIITITRKFLWSNKYKQKILNILKDKFEFYPNELFC